MKKLCSSVIVHLPIAMLILLFIVSCDSVRSSESLFNKYLSRLSNSLGNTSVGIELEIESPLLRYPSRRDLLHTIPAIQINLIEFLKLSPCDLQRHIGKRNSSLGSFMKESQALIYEYNFIKLAEQCLNKGVDKSQESSAEKYSPIDSDNKLYKALSQALETKRQQLPKVRWNAIFGSQEFSTLFSLGAKPLSLEELNEKPNELYLSLEKIVRFVNDDLVSDWEDIESAYSVVASSKRIGQIRVSMQLAIQSLSKADQLLQLKLSGRPLCFNKQPNKQFDTVQNVFLKFYIGEAQPYIAQLHQQAKALFERIDRLTENQPSKFEFDNFWGQVYKNPNSEWQRFSRSIESHTKKWQQLLSQCGRLPS